MLLEPYVNGIEKSASRPTLAWGAPQGLRVDPVWGCAPGTKGGPGEGERLRETQQFARLLPNHKTMIET